MLKKTGLFIDAMRNFILFHSLVIVKKKTLYRVIDANLLGLEFWDIQLDPNEMEQLTKQSLKVRQSVTK